MIKKFDKKYLLRSPLRVATLSRLIAKGIDLMIVFILGLFFNPIGLVFALIYMSISDSLQNGQSIGKRFMGLSVISLENGMPCTFKQSITRNLPFIVPLAFATVPLWGWVFGLFSGAIFMGLELYLLLKLDSGHRLGDVMADTTVIANDPTAELKNKKREVWLAQDNIQPS